MYHTSHSYARVWNQEEDFIPAKQTTQTKKIKRTYRKVDYRKTWLLGSSVFVFGFALLVVFLCIKGSTLGYQVVALEKQIGQLETANQRMELEIAQKSSLDRIEQLAQNELGMYKPQPDISFAMVIPTRQIEPANDNKQMDFASREGEKTLEKIYNNLICLASRTN